MTTKMFSGPVDGGPVDGGPVDSARNHARWRAQVERGRSGIDPVALKLIFQKL